MKSMMKRCAANGTGAALIATLLLMAGGAVAAAAPAQRWTDHGAPWTHDGDRHSVASGPGPASRTQLDGAVYQSMSMEADVEVGAGGDAGFEFRTSAKAAGGDADPHGYQGYYVGLSTARKSVVLGRAGKGQYKDKTDTQDQDKSWTEMIAYPLEVEAGKSYHLKLVSSGKSIDVYVDGVHLLSAGDDMHMRGGAGLRAAGATARFSHVAMRDMGTVSVPAYDFSRVKGAVFVPTNVVNYLEWWQNYDAAIVDRELRYAQVYGINTLAVYLHYLEWERDRAGLLEKFESFVASAAAHGMRVAPIFFDDCWDPNPHLGDQGAPIPGRHNSRWVQSPGAYVKINYHKVYKDKVRAYVQDIVRAHRDDPRILTWEQMNEAGCNSANREREMNVVLMNDARIAIKDTGSTIPVGSPSVQQWEGWYFSDFFSFHSYDAAYPGPFGPAVFNSESMNRGAQTVPGIVAHYGATKTGFVIWEFGIGRSNTRFAWNNPDGAPEPATPFHGLVYPDGHPWAIADVEALNGPVAKMPVFKVEYYNGDFDTLKKTSVTPLVDFDLNTERGTASPDASAGVSETNYAIRWRGTLAPPAGGLYTFYADSDNVARVWVNEVLVLNKTAAGRATVEGRIALTAGRRYPIRIEYVHASGASNMHLGWAAASMPRQAVTVVPD
jgi:hypothetical protein